VFRPDLEGKPVVVLSSNDGCVVARSNEAKALNINKKEKSLMAIIPHEVKIRRKAKVGWSLTHSK
jgi:nucleotidyltransferase/DNA polymerase involved in DNA repair